MTEINYSPQKRDNLIKRISAMCEKMNDLATRNGYRIVMDLSENELGLVPSFININDGANSENSVFLNNQGYGFFDKLATRYVLHEYLGESEISITKDNLQLARKYEQVMGEDLDILSESRK